MSLNFSFANVVDHEELHADERQWSITEHLIWHTMAVQMRVITEKNWREFAIRYFAWHNLHDTPEKGKVTVEDIKRRIGLCTNAPHRTNTQFRNMLAESLMEAGLRKMREHDGIDW